MLLGLLHDDDAPGAHVLRAVGLEGARVRATVISLTPDRAAARGAPRERRADIDARPQGGARAGCGRWSRALFYSRTTLRTRSRAGRLRRKRVVFAHDQHGAQTLATPAPPRDRSGSTGRLRGEWALPRELSSTRPGRLLLPSQKQHSGEGVGVVLGRVERALRHVGGRVLRRRVDWWPLRPLRARPASGRDSASLRRGRRGPADRRSTGRRLSRGSRRDRRHPGWRSRGTWRRRCRRW